MSKLKFDDLPKEIQEKMLDHQEAQGNKRDPEVFRKHLDMAKDGGGIDWSRTPERHKFWSYILFYGHLQTFYNRYPSPPHTAQENPRPTVGPSGSTGHGGIYFHRCAGPIR